MIGLFSGEKVDITGLHVGPESVQLLGFYHIFPKKHRFFNDRCKRLEDGAALRCVCTRRKSTDLFQRNFRVDWLTFL